MSGNLDLDGHDLTAGDITSTGDKYSISKDSGSPGYYAYGYNNSGSVSGILQMSKARGTEASPTAIQSGDRAGGGIFWAGYNGTSFANSSAIIVYATENHTASARGTKMTFAATPATTTSRTEILSLLGTADVITLQPLTGAYLRVGDAATTSHGLTTEDDLMVTGDFEVEGKVYMDSAVNVLKAKKWTVNYSDSSPKALITLPVNSQVYYAGAKTTTNWDGSSPTLHIGHSGDPDDMLALSGTELTTTGVKTPAFTGLGDALYDGTEKYHPYSNGSGTYDLIATITPDSSSQGVTDIWLSWMQME